MLKNRSSGEAIPAGEERPRKKLSFRDPEVMTPIRSAPLSAPPTKSSTAASPQLTRPHSVTGVVGLGGLSAQGGIPGMSSPSPPPPGSPFFKWGTTYPRIPSPSLSPKGVVPQLSNHSPIKSETKPVPIPEASKLRVETTRKDKSPLNDHVLVASPLPSPKTPAQTQAKSAPTRKAEAGGVNKSNQAKKNIPQLVPQQRQSLRKHHECAHMSPTCSQAEKDPNQPHHHPVACPSLEDLELENQAMRVVRTVGQAFEVVHKMTQKEKSSPEPVLEDDISREGSEDSSEKPKKDGLDSESGQEDLMTLTSDTFNEDPSDTQPSQPTKLEPLAPPVGAAITKKVVGETFWSPLSEPLPTGDHLPQAGTPLSVHHELQLLREQLEQQQQQTQAAVAQVHLLRDQLAAETAARLEAQARTHQLLVHNKELLEHIQQLVLQVREMEVKVQAGGKGGRTSPTTLPMTPGLPEMKTELSAPPSSGGAPDETTRLGGAPRAKQSSPLSPLSHTLPDTPPTPSPTRASHTFLFPPPLHPPGSCPTLSPLIPPLPLHRQQELPQFHPPLQQRPPDAGSSASLASDPGSAHSSGESVTAAIAQLYNMDLSGRLPLVPEDSVALSPFGTLPLSAHRVSLNGPITRAASERYSRQETLAQLQRMAWGRHTTK